MKITKGKGPVERIKMKTKSPSADLSGRGECFEWWKAEDNRLATELCGTAAYLKTNQTYRIRQIAASIRLYAGLSVYSYAGSNVSKMDKSRTLPDDKPTFNLIRACVDTLHSRLSQAEPQPKFLTDGGASYHEMHIAQQMNQFALGEFYQTKAYEKAAKILKDGLTIGCGALKVYEGDNKRVCVDRKLVSDLYVDDNDSINGEPQQLIELKLVDREKFFYERGRNKKERDIIEKTPNSYPDNSPDSGRTASDQIMVVEGWRLGSNCDPDSENYVPGRHTQATVEGLIGDEAWKKPKFPFVFFNYSDPWLGFFGQGIGTQLFGTQLSLQRILYTISRAINLVGVPRVFIEQGSKVVKSHNNNEIGVLITYSGVKPSYEIAPCNAPELYSERDKLIQYGFQETGVSSMQATSQMPEGLESGAAIRSYDDISTDRFAAISRKYDNVFIELAYQIVDCAKDIAERDGKYQTVYPNKDGTKEIDLPAMKFLNDPFVIKCFSESSLPKTPAGRIATATEWLQSGGITLKEWRRLTRVPQDLEENEKLATASEDRIFKILDEIVRESKYTPPDAFMDLTLAIDFTVKYYNLYMAAKLEESKAEMLRTFFKQAMAIQQAPMMAAQQQAMAQQAAQAVPQANPQPLPTSPLVPNGNPQPGQ